WRIRRATRSHLSLRVIEPPDPSDEPLGVGVGVGKVMFTTAHAHWPPEGRFQPLDELRLGLRHMCYQCLEYALVRKNASFKIGVFGLRQRPRAVIMGELSILALAIVSGPFGPFRIGGIGRAALNQALGGIARSDCHGCPFLG